MVTPALKLFCAAACIGEKSGLNDAELTAIFWPVGFAGDGTNEEVVGMNDEAPILINGFWLLLLEAIDSVSLSASITSLDSLW